MKVKMKLLSDTIFGNGESIPGGEDIAVLCDDKGFPYYRGGSFKGIFREELTNLLRWKEEDSNRIIDKLLGYPGDDNTEDGKIMFSDFVLPQAIKAAVCEEVQYYCKKNANTGEYEVNEYVLAYDAILNTFSHIRTFTAVDENGIAKDNSLRSARCVNKGLVFESEILCCEEDEDLVRETLALIKWIGSMRNRGFGKIELIVE